ncbi:MAG: phosphoglucosamine mutase [Rickettsiales bacterium]|nr:phosphoglucosamine mutase [Rickettsiales bacterium]
MPEKEEKNRKTIAARQSRPERFRAKLSPPGVLVVTTECRGIKKNCSSVHRHSQPPAQPSHPTVLGDCLGEKGLGPTEGHSRALEWTGAAEEKICFFMAKNLASLQVYCKIAVETAMARKYFGTDGVRARANTFPMTADFALRLGVAVAKILKRRNSRKTSVVIGKDTRLSCYMLESALTAGLTAGGAREVFLIGPIPTPGIAMLTRSLRCSLGIMISASHNPYYDNGIKLFDSSGVKFPEEIEEEIEAIIDSPDLMENLPLDGRIGRAWRSENYMYQQRYIEHVKSGFPRNMSLHGLRVVLDCANGASYRVAPTILWELGADVLKLGCQPDGTNINDGCGSMHPELLQSTVVEKHADLGMAFDGDADRIIMVSEDGRVVDGDKIIALLARNMLEEGRLRNNTVVLTHMSNLGLELYLRSLGLNVLRTKVGDRYVAEEMRKNDLNLGGEQSGHIIMGDYSTTGDGISCGLRVLALVQMAKQLNPRAKFSDLLDLYRPVPQRQCNIKFSGDRPNPLELEPVRQFIEEQSRKLENIGRVLVRKSGTEPLLRVMVECTENDLLDAVFTAIGEKIGEYL